MSVELCFTCGVEPRRNGAYCRGCWADYQRRYREANRERTNGHKRAYVGRNRARLRDAQRSRKYGLTPERYYEMHTAQGGACVVCLRTDRALHVDHDHACCPPGGSCGECVRGLLCGPCNRALGMLDDSIASLDRARSYLTRPPA